MGSLSGLVSSPNWVITDSNAYPGARYISPKQQEECIHCWHQEKQICNITKRPTVPIQVCCHCDKKVHDDPLIASKVRLRQAANKQKEIEEIQEKARKRFQNKVLKQEKQEGDTTLSTYWNNKAKKLGITVEELMERRRNDGLS